MGNPEVKQARQSALKSLKDFVTGKPLEGAVKAKITTELEAFLRKNVAKGMQLGKTADDIVEFYRKDKIVMKFAHNDGYTDESLAAHIKELYEEIKANPPVPQLPVHNGPKVGRNDPCPCGSGRKAKKCCYRG
ncbi:MAG: SEC-C metal-binding domain-containing protein [Dehalococcoidales bacterium]|nr:SEC-C metal-binding domain-containing protein [Dehalococcoidales bacterium]